MSRSGGTITNSTLAASRPQLPPVALADDELLKKYLRPRMNATTRDKPFGVTVDPTSSRIERSFAHAGLPVIVKKIRGGYSIFSARDNTPMTGIA